jgi:hypothetical protein
MILVLTVLTPGANMKVLCPKCGKVQEVKKDDFLGRYFVCRQCHHAASWFKHLLKKPTRKK